MVPTQPGYIHRPTYMSMHGYAEVLGYEAELGRGILSAIQKAALRAVPHYTAMSMGYQICASSVIAHLGWLSSTACEDLHHPHTSHQGRYQSASNLCTKIDISAKFTPTTLC